MSEPPLRTPPRKLDWASLKGRLSAPVTVTFPGWVFATAGIAALILLLIALD